MAEQLDKDRVLYLLAEADTKWFLNHHDEAKYREHLEFVAEHVASNYHKEARHGRQSGNHSHKR